MLTVVCCCWSVPVSLLRLPHPPFKRHQERGDVLPGREVLGGWGMLSSGSSCPIRLCACASWRGRRGTSVSRVFGGLRPLASATVSIPYADVMWPCRGLSPDLSVATGSGEAGGPAGAASFLKPLLCGLRPELPILCPGNQAPAPPSPESPARVPTWGCALWTLF